MAYAKIVPGEKQKQESVWRGPLDIKRTDTDFPFLIAFSIYILFWLAIAIYAYVVGDSVEAHFSHVLIHVELYEMARFFGKNIHEASAIIIGFTSLSIAFLIIFVLMFRWVTKILICIAILLMTVIIGLLYAFMVISLGLGNFSLITAILVTVIVTIYSTIVYAFVKIGIDIVCKVIKESCKAMFFFPSTLVLMIAQFILQILLISFTSSVYAYLRTIRIIDEELLEKLNNTSFEFDNSTESNETLDDEEWLLDYENATPDYIIFFHIVNCVGYLWMSFFIMGVGRMVLTATFATWYQVNDKRYIPLSTMPKCFIAILTYHTGTIAYASSIFSVFPMFCIIWKEGRDKLKEIYKRPLLIFSWLIMLMKFSFDALTISAIHGKTFYQSAKDIFNIVMKYPVSFMAINTVSECITFLGSLLIPILSILTTWGYCYASEDGLPHSVRVTAILVVFIISFFMSLTFFMVFRAASNTLRFCFFEDSKFTNEAEMNMYEIHADDLSIKEGEP